MSEEIKAIETKYKGCKFRSRLEARWAVLFDTLGVKWEYEKEGFDLGKPLGWYLPDFFLPEFKLWVELKGQEFTDDETSKLFMLSHLSKQSVVGIQGLVEVGQACVFHTYLTEADRVSARWRQHFPEIESYLTGDLLALLQSSTGRDWATCPVCKNAGIHIRSVSLAASNNGWNQRFHCYCSDSCNFMLTVSCGHPSRQMTFQVSNAQRDFTDFVLFLANGDVGKRADAITAARSARFEFGETPK